ncbi:MAG TPA: hypothetical protein VKG43_07435 [Acidimicrobiales bacterium]|nr:hypothetical protein [Acidimicrobiales bacterium]
METALRDLADRTDAQLGALRLLSFKFEVQHMMLAGGRNVWFDETALELEDAIMAVRDAEAPFRTALARAAGALGLEVSATLGEVAEVSPEPWSYIFDQGRQELRQLALDVQAQCNDNRKLLARGHLATTQALQLLGIDTSPAYDARGGLDVGHRGSVNLLNARA